MTNTSNNTKAARAAITRLGADGDAQIWCIDSALWECYHYGSVVPMRRLGTGDWYHATHDAHGIWHCDCGEPGYCLHRALAARVAEGLPDEAEVLPGGERIAAAPAYDYVRRSLAESTDAFDRLVRPALARLLDAEITSIEGRDGVGNILDRLCGIDCLARMPDGTVLPVAVRIQPAEGSYGTFTVRSARDSGVECEAAKLRRALTSPGAMAPYFHCQAYVSKDRRRLHALALCHTADLVAMIDAGRYATRRTGRAQQGQAEFAAVKWREMGEHYNVHIEAPEGR